jgi:hypothetical protein
MYTRIRTLLGGALVLTALVACGGSPPAETAPAATTPADTAPAVLTDVPLENQTGYPAPPAAVPAESTAYPGVAPDVPNEASSAYPGTTTTP